MALPGLALYLALFSTGCVHRRLTIRSNPPGALVYVDDQQIGRTPVSTNFIYYGTREVRLEMDGFETLTVRERIDAPWYQYPPIDFVAETFVPHDIRDERVLDFQLVPQKVVPTQELLGRANALRHGSQTGVVAPIPNTQPPPGATSPLPGTFDPGRPRPPGRYPITPLPRVTIDE